MNRAAVSSDEADAKMIVDANAALRPEQYVKRISESSGALDTSSVTLQRNPTSSNFN
jgi:hypothetical protein